MRNSDIERWALGVIGQVEAGQRVEDSHVELKREWPTDHPKTARQIAGHANSARSEPILWLIGVDEVASVVVGADYSELSEWFRRVGSSFDQLCPRLWDLNVPTNAGLTVVALVFETVRAPFVVRNPHFGSRANDPIELEVPWREGTRTRSSTRADLMLVLSEVFSLGALLNELEWNLDVAMRVGTSQWQYRDIEFERVHRDTGFRSLPGNLQRSLRNAYVAISHAQSVVRSYEGASLQSRGDLGREMINARLESRPHIRSALDELRELMGLAP